MKKFFYFSGFTVLVSFMTLFFSSYGFAANEQCWQHPIFIKPEDATTAKVLFNALPKKDQNDLLTNSYLGNVYKADINNCGKLGLVFITNDTSGSMGSQTVNVFQQEGGLFKKLGEPPAPDNAGDGPFYFFTYTNNNADEFITQLCGKTYISFKDQNRYRDTYLWKNGVTQNACDSDWVNYERQSFQTLYNQQLYDDAYSQLNYYANQCQTQINPQTYLWIQNDLARLPL